MFTERVNDRALAIARAVVGVAREIGATPAQVALAWLRTRPGSVIPIIGARRLEQARDNLACVDVTLCHEQTERLDDVSRIELGFPHEFIGAPVMQDRRSGGTYDLMVQHREP